MQLDETARKPPDAREDVAQAFLKEMITEIKRTMNELARAQTNWELSSSNQLTELRTTVQQLAERVAGHLQTGEDQETLRQVPQIDRRLTRIEERVTTHVTAHIEQTRLSWQAKVAIGVSLGGTLLTFLLSILKDFILH